MIGSRYIGIDDVRCFYKKRVNGTEQILYENFVSINSLFKRQLLEGRQSLLMRLGRLQALSYPFPAYVLKLYDSHCTCVMLTRGIAM